jgi:hypothetical protein
MSATLVALMSVKGISSILQEYGTNKVKKIGVKEERGWI